MHLVLLLAVLVIAIGTRLFMLRHRPFLPESRRPESRLLESRLLESRHWRSTIVALTLPAMFFLSTAMAILLMGHHGRMWGVPVNAISCLIAIQGLIVAFCQAGALGVQHWQLRCWLRELPLLEHPDIPPQTIAYYLEVPQIIAGQVGLWHSRIIVSQGLLDLPSEQIRAILAHEQAHFYYRDPLCGLGMSWLRRLCGWLPGSDRLWQDFLLLRECRADAWAAQWVDPLLLAEALVLAVRSTFPDPTPLNPEWVGLQTAGDRLAYRVQSLLQIETSRHFQNQCQHSTWKTGLAILGSISLGLLPLGTIAFHHFGHFLS